MAQLFVEFEDIFARLSSGAMSDQDKFLFLVKKLHPKTFGELRQDRFYKHRTEDYQSLKEALLEKSKEDWLEKHLFNQKKQIFQPLVQKSDEHNPPGNSSNTRSKPNGPHGKGKGNGKGEKGKGKMSGAPNNSQSEQKPKFSATIFCKYCGKKGHYEDSCWSKQKSERAQKKKNTQNRAGQTTMDSFLGRPPLDHEPHIVQEEDTRGKKRKADVLHVLQGYAKVYEVPVHVGEKPISAILDTGATTSAVAVSCVPPNSVQRSDAIPLQIGNGDYIWSLGTSDIKLQFGKSIFYVKAVVVETSAFDAVLGTDFMENEHVGGILTRPTRLLIDGQNFTLVDHFLANPTNNRLFRLFKTESYTLAKYSRNQVLRDLEVSPTSIFIDVFANHRNHQE